MQKEKLGRVARFFYLGQARCRIGVDERGDGDKRERPRGDLRAFVSVKVPAVSR